jgi:hypothetical protein
VPLKSVAITSLNPLKIEVDIQSASTNDKIVSDDVVSLGAASREVNTLRRRYIAPKIAYAKISAFNQQGALIVGNGIPFDQTRDTAPIVPTKLDNAAVAQAIRDKIALPQGMMLRALDVSLNSDHVQLISLRLSVQKSGPTDDPIAVITEIVPKVIRQLRTEQGAEIASYYADLVDAQDQPLLTYVKNYMGIEDEASWWQAPGMSQDWFPHPADESVLYNTPMPSPAPQPGVTPTSLPSPAPQPGVMPTSNPYPAPEIPAASPTSANPYPVPITQPSTPSP